MQPHDEGAGQERHGFWWVAAVFLFNAALNFVQGDWVAAGLFAFGAVAFWKPRWIDERPLPVRLLLIAALAALTVAMFVQTIQRARARY
jgi:cell division protein FtsW (lipid II flippase)